MRNFDWDDQKWDNLINMTSELIKTVSSGWNSRRFTPLESPKEILEKINGSIPLEGISPENLIEKIKNINQLFGYNGHPRWFGYITSSPDPIGVIGDFISSALNQNNNHWRIAPAATAIEIQVVNWFKEIFHLDKSAEGIFSSGGQFANIIAHTVARKEKCPWDIRKYGVYQKKMTFYVSDQAHYCHKQALDILGLGTDSLRIVPSNSKYEIDIDILQQMISTDKSNDNIPISIIGNVGTVGVGAIDPIEELIGIAKKENMWLHLDGAYGIPAFMTSFLKDKIHLLKEVDSIAFDPHKWLCSPIDAGVTIIKKQGALSNTFGNKVSYLDQGSSGIENLDLVDFTPENSRPFRALKVWMGLQVHGINGYKNLIEENIMLSRKMAELIEKTPNLKLSAPYPLSIVCWRYEPNNKNLDSESLNNLQVSIIEELERRGIALVSKAQLHDNKIALRACIVNFRTTISDIQETIKSSAEIGDEFLRNL